ncbi:MAG: methylenetetrahydrofolate--tRNA-(uracil(54)-C(5))-methyltransferase (FADH(2)-oxidizing) TrmFO, partial [Nitrospinota bacterium]
GAEVTLYEMRPKVTTPAHQTDLLAEMVCSNSFRSDSPDNSSGLLKEEMRRLGSLILSCADNCRVPAGMALAVDRAAFAEEVTQRLALLPEVEILREEVTSLDPSSPTVIASGPLTSQKLAQGIAKFTRDKYLYFYDAISPILWGDSIDLTKAFMGSRYGKGGPDYLNCPLDREEYRRFRQGLIEAEKVPLRDFEAAIFFEGCLPVEELAARGEETLAHGPLKPVGLQHPETGESYHAVVQLRRENLSGEFYSMVGFQTRLTYPAQRQVFRSIPALAEARFLRYGSIHRNTFINSPRLLRPTLQLRSWPNLIFGGQLTGVEGYLESAATGLLAGLNGVRLLRGEPLLVPPETTALGSLTSYLTRSSPVGFQPMNINFGLFPPLRGRVRRRERHQLILKRARRDFEEWLRELPIPLSAISADSKST